MLDDKSRVILFWFTVGLGRPAGAGFRHHRRAR